jgi:hypothetical protein
MNTLAQQGIAGTVEWLNTVVGAAGLLIALVALWQTSRANRHSDEANNISSEANTLAKRAMQLQEDEGRLRLAVKPQMLHVIGDGEDRRARPVVTIINLSVFPVTIENIWWKTADLAARGFFWKNPTIANPFKSLPARLEPRQALTALGIPDTFKNLEDLLSVTAAVASTECGEAVEGMTPQWKEYCNEARAKGKLHWNADQMPTD